MGTPSLSRIDGEVEHVVGLLRERSSEWRTVAEIEHTLSPRRVGLALRTAARRGLIVHRPRGRYATEWRIK
jgi:hypothetical protein